MVKAFLMYSEDYDETPPFIATMHTYDGSDIPDPNETWLADWQSVGSGPSDHETTISLVGYSSEESWPDPPAIPESGTLFTYTRFTNVYKCPDFERVGDSSKTQNVFNYTRAVWCRYWTIPIEQDPPFADQWGDVDGPIMKPSMVHAPSQIAMVLDEQWNRHVATAGFYGNNGAPYNCTDYGFYAENIMGIYHGTPVSANLRHRTEDYVLDMDPGLAPFLWKKGGVAYYDGHADLMRDPWPTFEMPPDHLRADGKEAFRNEGLGKSKWNEWFSIIAYMSELIFAQRGFDPVDRFGDNLIPPPW